MTQQSVRPLISCVTENERDWFVKTQNLVLSLREFGGRLSSAPVVAHFVDGVRPEFERALTRLDVEVRVVEPYGSRFRFSNKMRMFDLFAERTDFDVLVALDCDVLVMGDLTPFLTTEAVGIVPAGRDPFELAQWPEIYELFGAEVPEPNCIMRVSGEQTYPYYNTGVMTIPRAYGSRLCDRWVKVLESFGPVHERFPRVHHENQVAFAVAVAQEAIPITELPVSLNLSTVVDVDRRFRDELKLPFVIHYHQSIDEEGFVLASATQSANGCIDDFNRFRAELLGIHYSSLTRPPVLQRLQKTAATRSWYGGRTMRRFRKSALGAALKRVTASGERKA